MTGVAYRGWVRVAVVLLATGLLACESTDKGAAGALPQDGAVCVDRDGDGFGEGCSKGRDCDDAKAEITNECRSCLEPDQGCACETGVEPVACFLDANDLPDGRLMCHEGTRFCRDGAWSACESIHSYVMERRTETHLVPDAGHPNCTPCDVLCYRIDDNLDPVDGGLTDANSSGVSWIPGGGLSNTSFLIDAGNGMTFDAAIDTDAAVPPCQLGVAPDTDCDGLDDTADPYPNSPPFVTNHDIIHHELAAGQTGTSSLDLTFNVNNADIYFLIDQSGSMDGERDRLITDLRTGTFLPPSVNCVDTDDLDNLPNNELKTGGIIGSIRCLIRDAWFGAGYFVEYALAPNGEAYVDGKADDETVFRNVQTMTQSITDVNNALGTMFTNGNIDTPESDIPALYAMATGQGMYLGHNRQGLPPQTECPPDTYGYPCFRNTAIPIVILITDASFHNGPPPTTNAYQASYAISGGTSSTITPVPFGNEDFVSAFDVGDITNRLVTFGGDTKNAVGNIPGNLMGCGASSATRDVVFKFNITAPRVITIKTDGTVQDTLISLFSALPETAPSSSTPVTGESYAVGDVYDRWIEFTGSTSGLAANYQGGVLGCNAGAAGRDMLFSFTPSQNMSLTAVSGMSDRVGWWRMGDGDVYPNIADVTGEHDGSMKTMTVANFVADAPSGGTAFSNTTSTSFSGTNQRVEVANDFELDITDALTVSVWVKGALQDNTIVSKFETTGNHRSWRIATTTTGKARVNVSATGGPYDSSNVKEYNSAITVVDGTWHHIAFTYMAGSPDGTLKVYIDGVEDTNVTKAYDPLVPSLFSTSAPVTIGGYYSNSDLFVGNIDEVAVWHSALSAAELRVIYNHGLAQDLARIGGTTVALYSAPPPSNPATTAIANNNDSASSAYNVSNDLTGVYQAFSGNTSAVGVTPSMTATTVGCGAVDESNDVSYKFRLASNRRVRIDTEGSSFDTVLSLHSSTPAGLTPRASTNTNDNGSSVEAIGDISNLGYAYSGNSSALSPDFDGSTVGCSAVNGANDAIYSFTLPSMKHVHIDTRATTVFDSVVSLHSAVPAPVTTVSDNSNETLGTEGDLGTINGARKQLTGNTSAMTADYSAAIVGCSATGSARDAVTKFTLTSPATVEIDSQGSSFNTVLGLFSEDYPASHLVSWWRLGDGDTYPSVTGVINGFTGTMTNMAANDFEYVTPLQDYPNTLSTNFDGSNDLITIADNNTLDFTSAMTASVWVRGVGQDRTIFSKYSTTGNQRSWRIFGTAAGGAAVTVSRDGTNSSTTSKSYVTTGVTALDATTWHHVAFTFGGGVLKVYVDGAEASVTATYDSAMTTIFSGTAPVTIGAHDAASTYFNGNIDEPTLWNVALTATQIASLYNGGKPTDPRTLDIFPSARPSSVDVASTSTSLDFDGSNDTVLTSDTALNISNNLSVSLWANISASGTKTLASRYRTSPTNLRAWRMVSEAGRFRVYLSPNGSLTSPNYKDYSTVATVFAAGTWTHVAFTFASGTLKLYVNGVEATGAALNKTIDGAVATIYAPVSPAATRVGGYENNATGGVTEVPTGRIDELSIWSTTALTGAEITTLYNSGVPTNLTGATNLALWWRMGELDSYSTISDRAAVPHAGTMTNMASNDFMEGVPGATFYENERKAVAYDVGTINGRWRTFKGNTSTMIADTGGFGCGSGAGEKDAFFKVTLSSATSLAIDTIGSGFDTAIGVFPSTATIFNAGESITCDNDSGGSTTSSLTTGTLAAGTYYIVIKGSGGGSGAYELSIKDTAGQALANNILGTRVACSSNDGTETTSRITQTLAAGTYHVVVKSTGGSGAYNLRISEQGAASNQLTCARGTSAGSATPPDAGCTFILNGGHGYWFCNGARSWSAARTLCQAIGYDLISIDDAAEQAFVQTNRSGETHIGMNDIAVEGVYGWINGSTSTYTAYGSGQPNNNGGVQDCTEIYYADGTWNDNDCTETGHFICESGTLSPQVIDQTLAAGTYYVIVKGTSATAEGAYQMTIRDVDASTPPLYCNDDGSVDGSSAIEADLLANTDYYVTVKGKSASAKGAYRVALRDVTGVPSNLMACGNQDLTTTMLTAGHTYYAAVKGDALVGDGPFSLILQDSNNTGDQLIACDDNYGPGLQSRIDHMLNPGTYYLAMKKANHSRGQGNYQITFGGAASAASTYSPPTWAQTIAALNARRIRVMTVYSTGGDTLATMQAHADALANATNAVGSGGSPLVSSIAGDGTGLSSALVDQVQELAQYISMNMKLRVSYNPDTPPAPGFLFHFVAIDESPGNGCTSVSGFEHQQCLPGSTPRFTVSITNPLGSPVPPNPADPFGGYNFRIQLIANNQYVMDEVPVYIVPLQATYVPPNTRYAPVGVYTQDVDGRSCTGNERPSWRDLLFNTTVPDGGSVSFDACTKETAPELPACAFSPVATVTGSGTCMTTSDCDTGETCAANGVCLAITGGACVTNVQCASTATCVNSVCMYSGSPVSVLQGIGAANDYRPWLRLRVTMRTNPAATEAPRLDQWQMRYECDAIQ